MNVNERQVLQYGVRELDGEVTPAKGQIEAQDRAAAINRKAREIRVPATAKVVRRHVRVTYHTQPWEEIQ